MIRRNSIPLATKKVRWGGLTDPRLRAFVADTPTTADVIYRVDRVQGEPSSLSSNDFSFRGENGDGWKASI